MEADHFCLRWNNYQSNMVSELDILRTEEYLVDVTLSCDGKKFRAHKVILSACSAYFRNVFKENPCEHPIVILKDVNCEDVEALLSFVYQGVVYVSEKKLASFLQTAELLQIKGLTGAASTIKDESLSEKSTAVPNKPAVPARKVLPSLSPPPTKRRKGAPVRICKPNEEGEESDNSQREEDDQELKQERIEDSENKQLIEHQANEEETSMEAEGHIESNDSLSNAFSTGEVHEGMEDIEVKREDSTLLERSLAAASMSRSFESQGPFPPFSVSGTVPGSVPVPEQTTTGSSHLAQCGNCPHCGQKYTNQSALKYHVRLMHSDLTNRLCCYLCPRSFVQREQYKVHMWEKHKVRW